MTYIGRRFSLLLSFLICSAALQAHAGKLASLCVLPENSKEIKGFNVDKRLPLASVSKLITSLWATTAKGADSRFTTLFYVAPVAGTDAYDVHLKGSLDPYFTEQSLHFLVSRLNQLNVFKIRNLTFDENFKFYFNVNGKQRIPQTKGLFNPVDSQRRLTDPSPELVKIILSDKSQWLKNYNKTLAIYKNDFVHNPKLAIQSIDYLPSAQFKPIKPSGFIRSVELVNQLKMMNWNSNNHAANMIFQSLGGKEKFDKWIANDLKLNPQDINFVNGSGNNNTFDGTAGVYNSATCGAIVRSIKALKKSLEVQKRNLEDAVAVVGADHGATVSRYEKNIGINDGVIAKTGTINSNVALAGMISTKKGNFFFSINVATGGIGKLKRPSKSRVEAAVRGEWNRSRNLIGVELNKIVKSLGGATSINYKSRGFELESFEDDDTPEVEEAELARLSQPVNVAKAAGVVAKK